MRRRHEHGFTLIEIAVVLAIISILAIIAGPNLTQMMPRFRLNGTVREFTNDVQLARLLAVSQNVEYRLCMKLKDENLGTANITTSKGEYSIEKGNLSSGSTAWDVLPVGATDTEGKKVLTYSSSNRTYAGVSITGWTEMTGPGVGSTDCMVFSPRGWVTNPAGDFEQGFIRVYFRNKAAYPRNDSRTVLVSRGGLTRIADGDTPPTSGAEPL